MHRGGVGRRGPGRRPWGTHPARGRSRRPTGQDDASLHFLLGRALLGEGDDAGLRHAARAMELDPQVTVPACELAAGFLHGHGREDEADAFIRHGRAHLEAVEAAEVERDPRTLSHRDSFLPHGLGDEEVQALSTYLSTVRGLKRALLVRKEVTYMPEVPCFVMAVEPVWKPGELEGTSPSHGLAERIVKSLSLPGSLLVVTILQKERALEKAMAQVPGAGVFSRAAPTRAGGR